VILIMYVSVTALKTNGFLSAIRFWWLAIPTFRQAKSSKGVLFCEVKTVDGFHHTLTAWETKKDMKQFVSSPLHLKAMKVFPKIATGSTIGFEADEIPSWNEALEVWRTQAVNYT
jgi:hypothetical protein